MMQNPEEIHAAAVVIDGHADTPQRFVDEGWNFSDPLGAGMLNLESVRTGNLAAEFFAIWAEPTEWRGRYAHRTLQLIDGVYEQLRRHPSTMRLGLAPEDILQAHKDKVFCVLLGIEGGHSIEANLGLLRMYHRLGVRYMTLTWSNTNEWADSSGDMGDETVTHHGGLTGFGREVVRENESSGDDGGCFARRGHDILGCAEDGACAGDCVTFQCSSADGCGAEFDRRTVAGDSDE